MGRGERRAAYQQLGIEGGSQRLKTHKMLLLLLDREVKQGGRRGCGEGPPSPPPHCSMRNVPIAQWDHTPAGKKMGILGDIICDPGLKKTFPVFSDWHLLIVHLEFSYINV